MEVENNLKTYFENEVNRINSNIDVENAVMSKIAAPRKRTVNMKVLSFVAVITLCITGTGAVYGQEIVNYVADGIFRNEQGEAEWETVVSHEDMTYSENADEIYENLKLDEGKAVSIYQANKPDNVICRMEPVTVQDLNIVNSYTIDGLDMEFDNIVLEKYQFNSAMVTYDLERFDTKAFKEEAIASGKDVFIKEIEVDPNVIKFVACDYFVNGQTDDTPYFTAAISDWYGDKIIFFASEEDDSTNVNDKIMIAGSEVYYDDSSNTKTILWIYKNHHYSVSSEHPDMTKEELIEIAEQIKLKYQ